MRPAIPYEGEINPEFLPPESLWLAVEPLLPDVAKPTGRKRKPDRQMFFAIFYLLRTGIQWKALPRSLGAPSTVHDRFQLWVKTKVFYRLWQSGLLEADIEGRLDYSFQSVDGCATKAPLGGEATGRSPTDRGKAGVKRHIMTETQGIPLSLTVTGANTHDVTQVGQLLEGTPVWLPLPDEEHPQRFCADAAYDGEPIRSLIGLWYYEDGIKSRWDEVQELKTPGYRARRWVCERTHCWLNRYRRILVRWEKKVANYTALLHLCCALITWKQCEVFG